MTKFSQQTHPFRFVGIADEHGRLLETRDRKVLSLMPGTKQAQVIKVSDSFMFHNL